MSNKTISGFQFHKKTEIDSDLTYMLKTEFRQTPRDVNGYKLAVITNNGAELLSIPVFGFNEFQQFWNTYERHVVCMNNGKIVGIEQGNKFLKVINNQIQLYTNRPLLRSKPISIDEICERSCALPSIDIHNRLDPVTYLYNPYGDFVGKIRNRAAFDDVRAQIAKAKVDGYYVMYKGKKILLSKHGGYTAPPDGFYDSSDKSIDKILKL